MQLLLVLDLHARRLLLAATTPARPLHPAALRPCHAALLGRWQAVCRVIPDEQPLIEATLRELCDEQGCSLVVTTGGTGPAPRDVTPEATEAVRGGEADSGCFHLAADGKRGGR